MQLGISQAKLGKRLGVAQNTVARWERGEVAVSEPIARLLRIAAGEPVEEVLQGDTETARKKTAKK
jgi:transcriptional regulator with XRE-family HTH domain